MLEKLVLPLLGNVKRDLFAQVSLIVFIVLL